MTHPGYNVAGYCGSRDLNLGQPFDPLEAAALRRAVVRFTRPSEAAAPPARLRGIGPRVERAPRDQGHQGGAPERQDAPPPGEVGGARPAPAPLDVPGEEREDAQRQVPVYDDQGQPPLPPPGPARQRPAEHGADQHQRRAEQRQRGEEVEAAAGARSPPRGAPSPGAPSPGTPSQGARDDARR